MKAGTCFIILFGAAASALCAAEPPGPSSAAVQASSAPAQASSGAPQISSAPVPSAVAPPRAAPATSESNAAATQNVLPGSPPLSALHGTQGGYAGYTRVVIEGHELYCRNDVATGSRTERHTVCLTPAQWHAQQARAQTYIESVQRSSVLGGVNVGGMSPAPMMMH
jgi:hypothetical protein